jgi:RNA polymerase sigma-70 factor (ECF subfamily)
MSMTLASCDEASFMQRCAAGDAAAFDSLAQPYLAYLTVYLRQRVADPDDADELLQDVLVKAFTYLRESPGGVVAFFPWLKTVTTNTVKDYWRRRGRRPTVSLDDESVAEIADPAPLPEDRVIAREAQQATQTLWEFLTDQLREVFLASATTDAARADGLLRLLAFLLYYRDGQSAPAVHRLLTAHAARLGATPPSETTLNNWLARGRLLRMVLTHLIEAHADALRRVIAVARAGLPATAIERSFAQAYWDDGVALEDICDRLRFTAEECAAWVAENPPPPTVTFALAAEPPPPHYRLTPVAGATLYHVVRGHLLAQVCQVTKTALHDLRKA